MQVWGRLTRPNGRSHRGHVHADAVVPRRFAAEPIQGQLAAYVRWRLASTLSAGRGAVSISSSVPPWSRVM
jgi:hypothetical protein